MVEVVRSTTVVVTVDTNKDTLTHTYQDEDLDELVERGALRLGLQWPHVIGGEHAPTMDDLRLLAEGVLHAALLDSDCFS